MDKDCKFWRDCPPIKEFYKPYSYCCGHCKHKSENGCQLGEDRPEKCKAYDCRDYAIYCKYVWDGTQWIIRSLFEVPSENCDREFVDRYNNLMREAKQCLKTK
jgi:hypothetical protein